jgi:putative Mg2+ transporter-C (MgtC) family protein
MTVEPLFVIPCESSTRAPSTTFPNPEYKDDACYYTRTVYLCFLTPEECSFGRRLVASVVLGGIIGWERREADRPAGIRTMALVSLASCLFTLGSAFCFRDGPQSWDASRISAAIPSGVGFLGAGLIYKGGVVGEGGGDGSRPIVHGLTTAASLWVSAAVGIACGGAMYFAATFSSAILLVLLRFGPRGHETANVDDYEDEERYHTVESALLYGTTSEREKLCEISESVRSSVISNRGNGVTMRSARGGMDVPLLVA